MNASQKLALRRMVRFLYDVQRLRIQAAGRGSRKAENAQPQLAADDVDVLNDLSDGLSRLEAQVLTEVAKRVKTDRVGQWLLGQRGIGPTLTGVILSEVDFARCNTVSGLWKFAGCDVVGGHAPKRTKGVTLPYNGFLPSKLLGVAADTMLKSSVRATPPKGKTGWCEVAWELSRTGANEEEEPIEQELRP